MTRISSGSAGAPLSLILMLASVTALGPFTIQAIAPGLPVISAAMAVSTDAAQLLVSLSLVAMAVGAVIYGPLADHYGRRPVLLIGLSLACVGGVIAAAAPSYPVALAGRLLQAIGAGSGMVLARAAARDLFGQAEAASVIGKVTAAMVLAPMLAPALGGVLLQTVGWRGIFVVTAILAAALLWLAFLKFRETLSAPSPVLDVSSALRDYQRIGRRRAFWAPALFAMSSLAAFFLFVGGAPYAMRDAFAVTPAVYGLLFLAAALCYVVCNLLSPRVAAALGAERTILLGAAIGVVGGLGAALTLATGLGGIGGALALTAACAANAIGVGLGAPQAAAAAVSAAPERAGSASGLLSVLQFGAAAAVAQAATLFSSDAPAWLALGMAAIGAAGGLGFWALTGRSRSQEPAR